jgi:hypothetical protein
MTSRPIPGRLVVRPHTWRSATRRAVTHRAWQLGNHVVTFCGRNYPDERTLQRFFVLSAALVPVSCSNCLRRL